MSVARRFAVALAVVGTGVLAYAVPASATGDTEGGVCIENPTPSDLVGHIDADSGTATVQGRDGKKICADVLLSVYKVPDTWDGKGFNASAVPQQVIATAKGTLRGKAKVELSVPVPNCGNAQIDLYLPPEITTVDSKGHPGSQFIAGYIWRPGSTNGQPKECTPPTESPTPSETPSVTPSETPSETPSGTPTATTTAVPTPSPTEGLGAPIPVPPEQAPPAPPVLAETGSDSTVPLLGLGAVLLIAGIGLSLVGRRRSIA